jgi:hypothetical protein
VTAAVTTALATNWHSPPRFDGAGYAVLARSVATGRGYRAIDHPDEPRHAHFPPGYPLALAAIARLAGDDPRVFHLFSAACTVGATLTAHRWFDLLFGRRVGLVMGLALAVNWAWVRAGGGIQSEPLFELLGQLAILSAWRARRVGDSKIGMRLGALLGAACLTRHVAIALAAAVILDLVLARRWRAAIAASLTATSIVAPWAAWVAWVSTQAEAATQADLLSAGAREMLPRIGHQLVFYAQRIPDQLTGPYVEVATVFRRSSVILLVANTWSIMASLIVLIGWGRILGNPRRRLAGLVPLASLSILLVWPFTEAGRFLVPLVPCLLIGGVEGLSRVLSVVWGRRLSRTNRRLIAALLLLAASFPYTTYDVVKGGPRSREASHRDFDAACAWIAGPDGAGRAGAVLTRHPGEVFLQTGRQALDVSTSERAGVHDAAPAEVAATIARYKVAYLLIDDRRYANAPPSPLARFVAAFPERVRPVWDRESAGGNISIYEVVGPRVRRGSHDGVRRGSHDPAETADRRSPSP